MYIGQYMHTERTDAVKVSLPSSISSTGNLRIEGRGGDLCIFPPSNPADAEKFLAALIERATELRDVITERLEPLRA
jgi:hypothetical protein